MYRYPNANRLFPCFRYRGDAHVFAASDRPTVIHSTNGKLMFSNLNEGEVNHISSFGAKSYPDTLVLVKPDSLEVGSMDSIQVRSFRPFYQFSGFEKSITYLTFIAEATRSQCSAARAAPAHSSYANVQDNYSHHVDFILRL